MTNEALSSQHSRLELDGTEMRKEVKEGKERKEGSVRYAPTDPSLPAPWKGLIDGATGNLYFWNPVTRVTQYNRPTSMASSSVHSTNVSSPIAPGAGAPAAGAPAADAPNPNLNLISPEAYRRQHEIAVLVYMN